MNFKRKPLKRKRVDGALGATSNLERLTFPERPSVGHIMSSSPIRNATLRGKPAQLCLGRHPYPQAQPEGSYPDPASISARWHLQYQQPELRQNNPMKSRKFLPPCNGKFPNPVKNYQSYRVSWVFGKISFDRCPHGKPLLQEICGINIIG
jgi:hypothetical protein